MKLSMWILASWLKNYRTNYTITEGRTNLRGVRLFSYDIEPQPDYAYISRGNRPHNSEREEILVMNRMDVISIRDAELETILNELSSAFEYFNQWESELTLASAAPDAEQRILDVCQPLLPVMFVMGPDITILARTKGYSSGSINTIWDNYIDSDAPQLRVVSRMRGSYFNQLLHSYHSMFLYREPEAAPYDYGLMSSYVDEKGALLGQIVYAAARPIEKWEQQVFQVAERAFCMIHGSRHEWRCSLPTTQIEEALFASLITEPDSWTAQKLCIVKDWPPNGPFLIYAARGQGRDMEQLRALTIRRLPQAVCILREECILMLPASQRNAVEALWLGEKWITVGESLPFENAETVGYALRQASSIIRLAEKRDHRHYRFADYALVELLHSDDEEYKNCCLHPSAVALRRRDARDGTEYAKTVREYLLCDRSFQESGRRLFIHRNTVLSRLEKISDICPIPENPEERLYLLVSLCWNN